MAWITEPLTSDGHLQLGNEEFMRKVSFGQNWNKVRIACRLVVHANGNISNCGFGLGMGRYPYSVYDGVNCDIVSLHIGPLASAAVWMNDTLTHTLGATSYVSHATNARSKFTKVGSTLTIQAGAAGAAGIVTSGVGFQQTNRSSVAIDISRESTTSTITIQTYWPTAAQVVTNVTRAGFIAAIEATGALTNLTGSEHTITYGGSGVLDAVWLHWNRSTPVIEVGELTVLRIQ